MANTNLKEAEIYKAIKKGCPRGQTISQRLTKLLGENYEDEHSLGELANFYQISVLNSGAALWQIRRRIKGWASHGNILPEDAFLLCYFDLPAGIDCLSVIEARQLFHDYFGRRFFPELSHKKKDDTIEPQKLLLKKGGTIEHRKLLLQEAVLHFSLCIGLTLTESYSLFRTSCKCLGRTEMTSSSPDVYNAYRNLLSTMPLDDKLAQQDAFCRFITRYADQMKLNWPKSEGHFQMTDAMRALLENPDYCERLAVFLEESPYNRTVLDSVTKRVAAWKICKGSQNSFHQENGYSSDISRNELFLLCLFFRFDECTAKSFITECYGMKPTHPKHLFELICDYAISMDWDEYDVYDFYEEYRLKVRNYAEPMNDLTTGRIIGKYETVKAIAQESDRPDQLILLHEFLTKNLGDFSETSKSLRRTLEDIFGGLEKSIGSPKAICDALANTVDKFKECATAVPVDIEDPDFEKLSSNGDLSSAIELLRKYQSGQRELPREHLLWLILMENKRKLPEIINLLERCGFNPLMPKSNAFDWIFCRLLLFAD